MPNVHFEAFTLSNLEEGLFNFLHLKGKKKKVGEPQSGKGSIIPAFTPAQRYHLHPNGDSPSCHPLPRVSLDHLQSFGDYSEL